MPKKQNNKSPRELAELVVRLALQLQHKLGLTLDAQGISFTTNYEEPAGLCKLEYTPGDNVNLMFLDVKPQQLEKLKKFLTTIEKGYSLGELDVHTFPRNEGVVMMNITPLINAPEKLEELVTTMERRRALQFIGTGAGAMAAGLPLVYDGAARSTNRMASLDLTPDERRELGEIPMAMPDTSRGDPSDTRQIGIGTAEVIGGVATTMGGIGLTVLGAKQMNDPVKEAEDTLSCYKAFRESVRAQLTAMQKRNSHERWN